MEVEMKKKVVLVVFLIVIGLLLGGCDMIFGSSSGGDVNLEGTRVALAIQQTSFALDQARAAQSESVVSTPEPLAQPTYTPYPTYTSEAVPGEGQLPPAQEVAIGGETEDTSVSGLSFEDWMKDAKILVYDAMYGRGDTPVIENAIDGMALGRNTTNVGDAVGDFISSMNSATQWDLIIVGSEFRSQVQGEIFDVVVDQVDRGSSVVIESWYIDQVYNGRVQPLMQRCGITFHRDWWRKSNANLNEYLIYLLEPDNPMFSTPNTISMLIPYDIKWVDDVGDTVSLIPGSGAILLAGTQPKEHNSYGLLTECLDGRLVWQTFSTHDYKDQEMISLWQNYIYNALQARYEYLQ